MKVKDIERMMNTTVNKTTPYKAFFSILYSFNIFFDVCNLYELEQMCLQQIILFKILFFF